MVRISLGGYNDTADVDRASTPCAVAAGEFAGAYRGDDHGEFRPIGYREPALFALGGIR